MKTITLEQLSKDCRNCHNMYEDEDRCKCIMYNKTLLSFKQLYGVINGKENNNLVPYYKCREHNSFKLAPEIKLKTE